MPFGDTAKKIQQVTTIAEKMYKKTNELYEQLQDLRTRVENTSEQIEHVDRELVEQRAILEALAEEHGLDVDEIVAERVAQPEDESEAAGEAIASQGETDESTAATETTEAAESEHGGAAADAGEESTAASDSTQSDSADETVDT